jgi:P27 family predicted phage terminase small subunit
MVGNGAKRGLNAPKGLDPAGRELWASTQRHLRAQETWQDADAPLLESYVRAVCLARTAREFAAQEPFVEGSKGQLVAHPGLRVAAEAERDACRYATALLLTPEARQRHEIKAPEEGGELAFLASVG